MKAATELAKRILEKENAIRKTKSQHLKNDFEKSLRRDKNELLFYCRSRGFTIDEVFEETKKGLQTDTKCCKIDTKGGQDMKERLLQYRQKHGISQRKMAKLCGISPTTIERIEKGGKPSFLVTGKIERVITEEKE